MWVMTQDGFYSVVAYQPSKDRSKGKHKGGKLGGLLVRARARKDLEALRKYVPKLKIRRDDTADYLFRSVMTKEEWTACLAGVASELDYTNFKTRVGTKDSTRSGVYHRVWSVLLDIQENKGKGKGSSSFTSSYWSDVWFFGPHGDCPTTRKHKHPSSDPKSDHPFTSATSGDKCLVCGFGRSSYMHPDKWPSLGQVALYWGETPPTDPNPPKNHRKAGDRMFKGVDAKDAELDAIQAMLDLEHASDDGPDEYGCTCPTHGWSSHCVVHGNDVPRGSIAAEVARFVEDD